MSQPFVTVDAFAAEPFTGNPAAVCVLPERRDEAWMRAVAREMNLSETAFLVNGDDSWELRWFTPAAEVDLCGHATLAAAHVLWEEGHADPEARLRFTTRSGLLTARRDGAWIELDLPAEPARRVDAPPGLEAALGAPAVFVGRNRLDYLAELECESAVRELKPDFRRLAALGARGFIVTARPAAAGPIDFVSRYFAPAYGIDEDPVTGSAHCALAPHWAERIGRPELLGFQVSARGGVVRARSCGERVLLGGQAVTVVRGEILV